MDQGKLNEILEKHRLWLYGKSGGEQADLHKADLRGANLRKANLYYHSDGSVSAATCRDRIRKLFEMEIQAKEEFCLPY